MSSDIGEFGQTIDYSACDQTVYQQDVVIHRATGSAYEETVGGMNIWHLYVGGGCKSDYGDVRFTDSSGTELAYYLWPDYDSTRARFCVRLASADLEGQLTARYGNPDATTTSNGDAVYPTFDQFDGTSLNSAKWTSLGGATVSGGQVTITGSGLRGIVSSGASQFPFRVDCRFRGGAVEAYMCIVQTSAGSDTDWLRHGYGGGPRYYYLKRTAGSMVAYQYFDRTMPTVWTDSSVVWTPDSSVYYENGEQVNAVTAQDRWSSGQNYVQVMTYGGTVYCDYILVRAYSAAPPAATAFLTCPAPEIPPVAAFTASPTSGMAPLTVQFTDASTGTPTSWLWDFGDGYTSTQQHPSHTYAAPGTYSVNLTATNEYGSDEEIRTDYITVYESGQAGAVWESPVDTFSKILHGGKIPSDWGGVQGHSPVSLDDGTVLVVATSPQRTSYVFLPHPLEAAYRFDPRGVELYKGNSSKESYLWQSYHAFSGWDLVIHGWVSSWYTYSDPYSPRGISIADGSYVFIDTIPYARAYRWTDGEYWYGYQAKEGNSWWANIAPSGALISSKSYTGFVLRDIYERADGTFLAVAQKDISAQNPCAAGMVLSLSSTGEVISSRILYPGEYVGSDLYRLSPAPGTGGQEFWVIGYRYKDSTINAELIPLVLRIDSEGNTLSEYIYKSIGFLPKEPPSFNYQVHPATAEFPRTAVPQIRSTDDGGAVWTYTTVAPEGNIQSVLIKITPAGVIEWSKSYPAVYEGGNCQIAGVCPRGGGYLLLLKDGTYFRVAQTDSSGTILSDIAWGTDSGGVTVPYDLAVRGDAYIVSGGVSRPDLGSQGFVVVGESTDESRVDGPRPEVSFSATPVSGAVPLTVSFTDTSTPSASWVVAPLKVFNSTTQILAWHWDFGDGEGSSLQNPVHTYTEPGLYTVTLTGTNAYGSTTLTREDLIVVAVNGPIYVATYEDLCKVGTDRDGWTADAEYLQTADIQCPAGVSFTPIGTTRDGFSGSYDGQGHVIRDLYINRPDGWGVGLFGEVEGRAVITNVTLEEFSITAGDGVGGLVGYLYGEGVIIENCTVSGTISGGEEYIGGLIGYADAEYATITDCHADVKILGEMIYEAGGLIGTTYYCNVTSCSAQGDITYADEFGGGLIGYCYGSTITDCHAHGDVAIDPDARYQDGPNGGLVGYLYMSSAFNCSATGDVIGGDWATGGLVGYGYQSTVARCYASGNVSGYEHVGGLIGYYEPRAEYSLDDCYATGNVVSSGSNARYCSAGGLIGLWDQYQITSDGYIRNVYSAGRVEAPNLPAEYAGGLIGKIDYGTGVVATAAYWDTETSGQATSAGNATGKTTAEMQTLTTYVGWDIAAAADYVAETWYIVPGEDYPRLAWEGVPAPSVTSVTGYVYSVLPTAKYGTSTPISGASVSCNGSSATTGADGSFTLVLTEAYPAGTQLLITAAVAHCMDSEKPVICTESPVTTTFRLWNARRYGERPPSMN